MKQSGDGHDTRQNRAAASSRTEVYDGQPDVTARPAQSLAQRTMAESVDGSPLMAMQRQKLHSLIGGMEQRKTPLVSGPCQRVIDTSLAGMAQANLLNFPNNPFSPLPSASKTVSTVGNTTKPADPVGMDTWRQKGYLGDPTKNNNQCLTRMHAIRGKFGGPTQSDNMFLGTAYSNNFNANSHFSLVEKPLEDYLKGGSPQQPRAFDYTVAPYFGSVPGYIANRIKSPLVQNSGDAGAFTNFAIQSIPASFVCSATLYVKDQGGIFAKTVHEPVATDVGASSDPVLLQAPLGSAQNPIEIEDD